MKYKNNKMFNKPIEKIEIIYNRKTFVKKILKWGK